MSEVDTTVTFDVNIQSDVPTRITSLPADLLTVVAIRRGLFFTAMASSMKSNVSADKVRAQMVEQKWSVLAEVPKREGESWTKYWRGRQTKESWQALFDRKTSMVVIGASAKQEWWWNACSRTPEELTTVCDELRELLPLAEAPPESCSVTFWNMSDHGPSSSNRFLSCPEWGDELVRNYIRVGSGTEANGACPELADLVELRRPEGRGSLILMHGAPGTGKTYAIRALARAWSPWCNTHYVVDPETLFRNPEYMTRVLMGNDDEDCDCDECARNGGGKWRLVVMEDADEFLAVDAKMFVGQSLGRLLNVTDGIMGQGLQLLVLITTNEPLSKIHEAVSREGRCLANMNFRSLNEHAASEWLRIKGGTDNAGLPSDWSRKSRTLAELYAVSTGKRQIGRRSQG